MMLKPTSDHKKYFLICCLIVVLSFCAGGYVGYKLSQYSKTAETVTQQTGGTDVTGTAVAKTTTYFSYEPKKVVKKTLSNGETIQALEDTDIEVSVAKPELNVKVNDKEVKIHKADNEKYIFDKNKLTMEQGSKVDFSIHVDPIDNTKHWGVGIGATGNGEPAALVTIPINKKKDIDGWIYKDVDKTSAGVMIRF